MNRFLVGISLTAFLAGALVVVAPGEASARQGTITGQVIDGSNQQPLVGAQVFLVGTNRSAITNQEGRYLIPAAPAGEQVMRVVLIGYSAAERTVSVVPGGTATADFSLVVSAVELDALVVNAITGQRERRRAIGSNVGSIQVDELNLAPITSVSSILAGRTPGVILQSTAGTLGTGERIRIRGANSLSLSNDPLIIVDGVQITNGTGGLGVGGQDRSRFNDLDATDIANIEILKGPAASALYGTAAANGVVLVTTKRGHAGDTNWTFYSEMSSLSEATDFPDNVLAYELVEPGAPLLTDQDFLDTDARAPCFNVNAAQGLCQQDSLMVFNTLEDPRTSPLRDGFSRTFGLSASGGGDVVQYYLSGDWEESQGVVFFNKRDRINLRANLDARLRDDLRSSVHVGYTDGTGALNNDDNSIFSPLINGLMGNPYFVPPGEDGSVNRANYPFGFSIEDLAALPSNQAIDRFIMGVNTTYTPESWLTANVNLGMDLVDQHDFETLQPNRLPIAEEFALGFRTSRRRNSYNYTGRASLAATFEPFEGVSSTTAIAGSFHRELLESTHSHGAGIIEGTENLGNASSLFTVDEVFTEARTIGALVRQQFAYDNRIFFNASLRGDDNSAFGTDFGLILYPAVSASWVAAEEDWFPQTDYVSDLRVRVAYGKSGQRPEFRDALTFFSGTPVQVGGGERAGIVLGNTGNTGLEPEKVSEYEVGFDLGLLRNRVGVQFTYFTRESEDALIAKDLAPSLGLTGFVFDNLGSLRNRGTELAINASVLDLDDVSFDVVFTNATLDNEILEIGTDDQGNPLPDIIINRGEQRHRKGHPAGAFFQPGILYEDENGDGLLSTGEVRDTALTYIGPAIPTYTRSLGANLTLFDLVTFSTLFEARGGNYQLNGSEEFRCGQTFFCPAAASPDASLEDQAAFIGSFFYGTSYGYIEKADFIRWREASVTLRMPEAVASRVELLRGATFTLAGSNLALWTDYPGLDPEVNESGSSNSFLQNEFNTMPPPRVLTARLTFQF